VKKNICSQDRISLSFNTWTDGTIGTLMGSDYLNLDNPQMHDVPMFDLDIRREQK